MVAMCSSYCRESVDMKFLIVVAVATKLLKIKVTRSVTQKLSGTRFVERDNLCFYTEMDIGSISGVYHVKP